MKEDDQKYMNDKRVGTLVVTYFGDEETYRKSLSYENFSTITGKALRNRGFDGTDVNGVAFYIDLGDRVKSINFEELSELPPRKWWQFWRR